MDRSTPLATRLKSRKALTNFDEVSEWIVDCAPLGCSAQTRVEKLILNYYFPVQTNAVMFTFKRCIVCVGIICTQFIAYVLKSSLFFRNVCTFIKLHKINIYKQYR